MQQNERLFVVSPHFDDGVFSCGAWLAARPDSTVCTVFSAPPPEPMQTDWDRRCGFEDSRTAMRERRAENARALAQLNARAACLDLHDSQYRRSPAGAAVAAALGATLHESDADTVLMPLGLFHSDHVLTSEACLAVQPEFPGLAWFAYEDALYRRLVPQLQQRLAHLLERGVHAVPVACAPPPAPADEARKREAVACYRSQLRAFGPSGYDDVFAPERYWALSRAR